MPTVTDPTGREWVIEEIGLASNAVNIQPGGHLPDFTLSTLRVASGDKEFVVSIGRAWRELSNAELWKRLADARARKDRQSSGA